MDPSEGNRNVVLYRLHVIFNEPLFWGPVLVISLQNLAHMSLPDIYYMEAVVLGLCVVLDIPSGALADVIGRKKTIIIGRIFLFASVVFFATMHSSLDAWIGNILWAIGYTMQSGADTALLYDTLKEHGKHEHYKSIEGKAVGTRLILIACCSLLAGVLAGIELRLPLLVGIPFMLIPLVVAFFFTEPRSTEEYSAKKQLAVLTQGVTSVLGSKKVCWIVGFAALLATTSKVWFFTYNPYFEAVGLPIAYYGAIFFLLNAVAWIFSSYAYRIEHLLGERRCVIGMVLCLGIPILLMGLVPIQPFAYLVLVQNIVRGFMRPFVGDYLNRRITAETRATVLSIQSSVANFTAIVGLALFGLCMQYFTLLHSLLLLGAASLALGLISYRTYTRDIA